MSRNKAKRDKKQVEKAMEQKLMMFDKLGDHCAACQKPFDKKSKEHASSWNVIVREKEQVVRLYCPNCWETAVSVVQELGNNSSEDKQEK